MCNNGAQEHGCKTGELFSESLAIKERLRLLLGGVPPATSPVWVPSLQAEPKKGAATSLIPVFKRLHLSQPQKEHDRAVQSSAPRLLKGAPSGFMCRITPGSLMAPSPVKMPTVSPNMRHGLTTALKRAEFCVSVGNARPEVRVCPARRCVWRRWRRFD